MFYTAHKETIGILGQWLGFVSVTGCSILEIVVGGDWFLVGATIGALVWGTATKIRGR